MNTPQDTPRTTAREEAEKWANKAIDQSRAVLARHFPKE